jgi:hypothetical protein
VCKKRHNLRQNEMCQQKKIAKENVLKKLFGKIKNDEF